MAFLSSADIAAIKAYIGNDSPASSGLYSIPQISKWTNPDVTYSGTTQAIDQTIYSNMITDAGVYYSMYYGSVFSSTTEDHMAVMAKTVILNMMHWRQLNKGEIIRDELIAMRKRKLRRQSITCPEVPFTENSRNIDSSDTMYQGPGYDNKL